MSEHRSEAEERSAGWIIGAPSQRARAMSSPVIGVTWGKGRTKDRQRAYAIYVDDVVAGELRRGRTTDVSVPAGRHVVRVSVELEHSRQWDVVVSEGDVVALVCRPRGKLSDGRVDLFLADPADPRATLPPLDDLSERDFARKQRVVGRDGQVLFVWAHKSGYLRSLDIGTGDPEAFLLEMAYYVLVLPVLGVVRSVRHRLVFKRGWSVGVVRKRRFLWPTKVRLERLAGEAEARARAAQVLAEMERWPAA
jgi:hypothetical protein